MKDIDCGPYLVTLQAGSSTASVDIFLVNDEDSECDEEFTAQIVIGAAGFRGGQKDSASIIVKDDEGDMGLLCNFLHYACDTAFFTNYIPHPLHKLQLDLLKASI